MSEKLKEVYILGHKNPDSDSICSAIAYTAFKNSIAEHHKYIPGRCGNINNETKFILNHFGFKEPELVTNLKTQIKDIEIREIEGVSSVLSLKKAWELMKNNNLVTLPIVDKKNKLEGLITISDIAKSCMEIYDSSILAEAKTPFENLIEVLDGEMIVGNSDDIIKKGRIFIAAANPELMEDYIEKGDIIIVGDRFEAQLCAVKNKAGCIIVCCRDSKVSNTIQSEAKDKKCKIIKTNYDTYTATRLVNQSMPIKHFMRCHDIITFTPEDYLEDIHSIMAQKRHRDFPVVDKDGRLIGMISRRNLIGGKRKQVILVDHNEKSQAAEGIEDADILEIIDHHRIANVETVKPVFFRNQPLGSTSTIVSLMFKERNIPIPKDIAGILCSAIISDTLILSSPTCTVFDVEIAHELAEIAGIKIIDYAKKMFSAGVSIKNKKIEDIFFQDFKMFSAGKISFGVGQFNIMDYDECSKLKNEIFEYMKKVSIDKNTDMIYFMLTNILEKSSLILFYGKNTFEYMDRLFYTPENENEILVEDFVSRKKQFVPLLMNILHTDLG